MHEHALYSPCRLQRRAGGQDHVRCESDQFSRMFPPLRRCLPNDIQSEHFHAPSSRTAATLAERRRCGAHPPDRRWTPTSSRASAAAARAPVHAPHRRWTEAAPASALTKSLHLPTAPVLWSSLSCSAQSMPPKEAFRPVDVRMGHETAVAELQVYVPCGIREIHCQRDRQVDEGDPVRRRHAGLSSGDDARGLILSPRMSNRFGFTPPSRHRPAIGTSVSWPIRTSIGRKASFGGIV